MRYGLTSLAAACVWAGAMCAPASAQAPGPGQGLNATLQAADPALRSQYEALFQRILANPADLDANFRFSEIATRIGDLEAAIGALERIVFYNPNLPRVRLELGILYFRLGSYAMAREYFETTLAGASVPPEVASRAQGFLVEIDRRLSTTQWSFVGQTGLRYQTNASAGPSSTVVRSLGTTGLPRSALRPALGLELLRGRHAAPRLRLREPARRRVGDQRRDLQRAAVQGDAPQRQPARRADRAAPRPEPRYPPGAYVRPYFVGGVLALGNYSYLGTVGGGVGVGTTFGSVQVEPFVEFRHRSFDNSPLYRTATQQNGDLWTAGIVGGSPLHGTLRWQARAAFVHNDTQDRFRYFGFDQATFDLGLPFDFAGPWGERPWTLTPLVGFSYTDYDAPNPLVDPRVRREDTEWRVGAGIDLPVFQNVGLGAQVTYSRTDSNIRNYRIDNLAVSFGPTLRF
jgi:hypothetical protein